MNYDYVGYMMLSTIAYQVIGEQKLSEIIEKWWINMTHMIERMWKTLNTQITSGIYNKDMRKHILIGVCYTIQGIILLENNEESNKLYWTCSLILDELYGEDKNDYKYRY